MRAKRRPPTSACAQAFLRSARAHSHFAAGPLPLELAAQLSVGDQVRVRDRATILSRHVYADMGDKFADEQVGEPACMYVNAKGGGVKVRTSV